MQNYFENIAFLLAITPNSSVDHFKIKVLFQDSNKDSIYLTY